MSTISLFLTSLILYFSQPMYTEFFHDKDAFFYYQKGNFYTVTNLKDGKKTIGVKTKWGNCFLKIYKTSTKKLILAEKGFEEVKKQISQNKSRTFLRGIKPRWKVRDKFDENNYKYYESIMADCAYSDSLAYTFLCWRTGYQMSNYGVSNYSIIPNNFYNSKKRIVINKLKRYSYSANARQQIAYLENLSDIVKGGFMGNSVLNDLVLLSGD